MRPAGFIVPTLREHIYKENNILYPTALQVIEDEAVWQRLKGACDAIGYCCSTPENVYENSPQRGMGVPPMQHRRDADATKPHGQDACATFHTRSET